MLRKILGVIAGIIAAIIAIMVVQQVSHMMYPMPEGLSLEDKAGLQAYVDTLPVTAFLLVIISYVLGSFAGGYVSTLIAKTKFLPALIVGGLLALAAILNGMAMPQPLWVSIVSVLVMLPMAWLGAKMVKTPA